jgi:hypothetical protein
MTGTAEALADQPDLLTAAYLGAATDDVEDPA